MHTSFLPYGINDLPRRLQPNHPATGSKLSHALIAYLKRLGAPSQSLIAAGYLSNPHSHAILSGQQAGLLTGPAFTFYKAHSAMKLAQEHHQEDRPVVAVFWVASQDHDTQEIQSTTMLDFAERFHGLSLPLPNGHPAGRVALAPYFSSIQTYLQGFGGYEDIRQTILDALEGPWTFAEGFARIMLQLMPGLVLFDPMAPELAPLFMDGIEREIAEPLASAEAINRTAALMKQAGLEVALRRADGATNLFLEGHDGVRRLLRFSDQQFDDGTQRYSRAALTAILHHQPSRITPAAGLRPVLQDTVLPTAGFVVGPGELKYVSELKDVYALHGLEHPAVIRRMGLTWLEPPVERILQTYGLSAELFQQNPEATMLEALAHQHQTAQALNEQQQLIGAQFDQAASLVSSIDPTLLRSLQRANRRVSYELRRLQEKVVSAELRKEGLIRSQFERLKAHLTPQGQPQERVFPLLMYLLKHGPAVLSRLQTLPATGHHYLSLS